MDLGRYADYMLNFVLMCTVFFFSSAWIMYSAQLLVFANVYVYMYDRYRSVRYMGEFKYSTNKVDDVVGYLLGFPPAVLAGALMYHLRLMRAFGFGDRWTIPLIILAMNSHMLLHVLVHHLLIRPLVSIDPVEESIDEDYAIAQKETHRTYFNSNKIHCLRAKYLRGDKDAPEFFADQEALVRKKKES
jgi:hypothetical protein